MSEPTNGHGDLTSRASPEVAIIASVLREGAETYLEVADSVHADDFYGYGHRLLWTTFGSLIDEGKPIDLPIVYQRLLQNGHLDDVGGESRLASLFESAGPAPYAKVHAEIIREHAEKRRLLENARRITEAGSDPCTTTAELRDMARRFADSGQRTAGGDEWGDPIPCSHLQEQHESERWVWRDFIAFKSITMLSALWKAGKSTFVAHLLRKLARGGLFCGRDVFPTDVVYVTEESQQRWARRRKALDIEDNVSFCVRPFKTKASPAKWARFLSHLHACIDKKPCGLIVFDTLSNLWPVTDENNAAEVQAALMPLQALSERTAVLVVHHLRKADGTEATAARGSGALPAFVDTILELRRFDATDRNDTRRVVTAFGRDDETPPELVIKLERESGEYDLVGDRRDMAKREIRDVLLEILPRARPGFTFDDLKEKWPGTCPKRATLAEVLAEGTDRNEWIRDGEGVRGRPLSFWIQERPNS
jgi:hypothetical protein